MEETVNQATETQATEGTTAERSLPQEEVNRIVAERVQRERAKYTDYDALKEKAAKFDEMQEASKTELQKATEKAEKLEAELKSLKKAKEVDSIRNQVAQKVGVPATLLHGTTEEDCTEEAKAILAFAQSNGYPEVKDAGETKISSKHTTADQFADWMKKNTR